MPSRIPLPRGMKAALLRRFDQRCVRAEQMHVVTERVHDLNELLAFRAASWVGAVEAIKELEQALDAHVSTDGDDHLVIESLRGTVATVWGDVDRIGSGMRDALQRQATRSLRDPEHRHESVYRQAEPWSE